MLTRAIAVVLPVAKFKFVEIEGKACGAVRDFGLTERISQGRTYWAWIAIIVVFFRVFTTLTWKIMNSGESESSLSAVTKIMIGMTVKIESQPDSQGGPC
jgi:hypothetical protein